MTIMKKYLVEERSLIPWRWPFATWARMFWLLPWLIWPITRNKRRQNVLREPTERGALALIRVGSGPSQHYVLQWNPNWRMYNLLGGKMDNGRGDANDFSQTLRRELCEEIGAHKLRFRVVRELRHIILRQYSHREERSKNYDFAVFEVELDLLQRSLDGSSELILATPAEIERLTTRSGQPISLTTRRILQALGELPAA